MGLTGEAKKRYQREYMRKRRRKQIRADDTRIKDNTVCQPKYQSLSIKQILEGLPLANYNNYRFIPLKDIKRDKYGNIIDKRYKG